MDCKRILVTARYLSGTDVAEGGSSRFMRCVIDTLQDLGHDVVATTNPEEYAKVRFNLIICSHKEKYFRLVMNPSPKLFISHGLIYDENPPLSVDHCVSISEEVRVHNYSLGTPSRVIGQPVRLNWTTGISPTLRKILVIRRYPVTHDPFFFLLKKYDLRYSDPSRPIEEQIEWADLCITLGRGVLEAMAQGRLVLVGDNRQYIGEVGDGYVDGGNVRELAKCNFSGRRYKTPITEEWVESELAKYNPLDANDLYDYVQENHEAKKVVGEYLQYAD
jgi:hypothetical protein